MVEKVNYSIERTLKRYYKKHLLRSEDEVSIQLTMLKLISSNPDITQREISKHLGISLGKTNYVIKSFINKGLLKLDNFRKSDNKMAYKYLLTKSGIKEKLDLTKSYLVIRIAEYDKIQNEIKELNNDIKLLGEIEDNHSGEDKE